MTRPSPPTALQVDGHAESGSLIVTKNTDGNVVISAVINDPDAGQPVRLVVQWSTSKKFASHSQRISTFGAQGLRRSITMGPLSKNTTYYGRAWTQDKNLTLSASYNSFLFATDRYPLAPTLIVPNENVEVDPAAVLVFDWKPVDLDETADPPPATGFTLEWRTAGTPLLPPGPWVRKQVANNIGTSWAMPAHTLKSGQTYEWHVRTRDPQNQWGAWSFIRSFTTSGVTKPPVPLSPASNVAVVVDDDVTFKWLFKDPLATATQGNADIQYRVAGSLTWNLVAGAALTDQEWTFAPGTFLPGFRYEWQVRTSRATGTDPLSDWSPSAFFWSTLTPGSLADIAGLLGEKVRGRLGQGRHRIYVFDQGGLVRRGEIDTFTNMEWTRQRDDISTAQVTIDGYGSELGKFLGKLRSWHHELVITRDNERVWEGPIVHREMRRGQVVLSAKDPMAYLYRRILRQGYNDGYRLVAGVQTGLKTVVERAGMITMNALAYYDPNVLPYLTLIQTGDDARQSRIVPDYTKTAWQEIDDLASNAGLDYTTVGRRIMYWDTHVKLGQLPEMSDGDFSEPVVLTEYGMSGANFYAVTDGNGAYGTAIPAGKTDDDWFDYYGPLEQLSSAYGDATPAAGVTDPAALAALQANLAQQATRNINGRYPLPMAVRVPDNSQILPSVNITINQLVPGVWIPISVQETVQAFKQMQKLNSVTVSQSGTEAAESVRVVMSPTPLGADDPDAAGSDEGSDEE